MKASISHFTETSFFTENYIKSWQGLSWFHFLTFFFPSIFFYNIFSSEFSHTLHLPVFCFVFIVRSLAFCYAFISIHLYSVWYRITLYGQYCLNRGWFVKEHTKKYILIMQIPIYMSGWVGDVAIYMHCAP